MNSRKLSKCSNCGAELEAGTSTAIKCAYCGSVFETAMNEEPPPAAPLSENEEVFLPVETSRVYRAVRQEKNINTGAIIICVLVLIGLIATIHNYAIEY